MPGIKKHGVGYPVDRLFKITIRKYDRRILPAQFKRNRLHCRRYCFHDRGAGSRFAGKCNRIHIRMLRQELSRRSRPEAMYHVINAIRNSRVLHRLGKKRRCRRSFFGRLDHHRIPASQRRRNFPGEQQQGQIPRRDHANDPQWLAHRIVQRVRSVGSFRLKRLQPRHFHQVGEDAEIRRRARNIEL